MRRKQAVLWMVLFLLVTVNLLAGGIEDEMLPVPAQTDKVDESQKKISGSGFTFSNYVSSQNANALKEFYRQQLSKSGWAERSYQKELSAFPEVKIEGAFKQALETNLTFERNEEVLIITFLPANIYNDKKTRFSVAKGMAIKPAGEAQSLPLDFVPQLEAEPQREVAPAYPGAVLTNLSEDKDYQIASYVTQDELSKVAYFYRNKMLNYGWMLVEESVPEKMSTADYSPEELAKYCPSCAQKLKGIEIKPSAVLFQELGFKNETQDNCTIGMTQTLSGNGPEEVNFTTITVHYYAEKK